MSVYTTRIRVAQRKRGGPKPRGPTVRGSKTGSDISSLLLNLRLSFLHLLRCFSLDWWIVVVNFGMFC